MNEHGFSKSLRTKMHKVDPSIFWWKINDAYAGGTPDIFIEGVHRDIWCEAKYIKELPKRDTTMIDFTNTNQYLSKLQQEWLIRRHHKRGDTLVAVGHPDGCLLLWGLSWQTPMNRVSILNESMNLSDSIARIRAAL